MIRHLEGLVFIAVALTTLTPWVTAPMALLGGMAFALFVGNPYPKPTATAQRWLLQASVVGLGGAMDLRIIGRVGSSGVVQTVIAIVVTLAVALAFARLLKTEATTSLLIGVGTAICGGSAIAAVAPAIGAKSHQSTVSLAVVFLLNSAALIVFPMVGHALSLSAEQFGLWSALAIHDTSSVVGASMQYGPTALAVGTTVKLVRALWIVPLTLVLARLWHAEAKSAGAKARRPWFIAGFVAVAALVTFVPALAPAGKLVAQGARQTLVATLFLVGAGVSRDALRAIGIRPLLLGVLLWVVVAAATLEAIHAGLLAPPAL
jgi:uncharacterized integral membrane protein (TIGR00698 family)